MRITIFSENTGPVFGSSRVWKNAGQSIGLLYPTESLHTRKHRCQEPNLYCRDIAISAC